MTQDRWADLRARAAEATPGPWRVDPKYAADVQTETLEVCACFNEDGATFGDRTPTKDAGEANAAYIAAASPLAVLALLAERDALRAALRDAEPWLSEAYQFHRMTQGHAGRVMKAHDALAAARAALAAAEDAP